MSAKFAVRGGLLGLVLALSMAFSAAALTIDGNLSDWGVTPGNDWSSDLGASFVEDYVGYGAAWNVYSGDGNGYVGPAWGGQDFDMEAMYLYVDNASRTVYFALSTGVEQLGSRTWNGETIHTGDVFFDFGQDGWDTAVKTTQTALNTVGTASVLQGFTQLQPNYALASTPWAAAGGTTVGNATFIYTDDATKYDHNIVELCFQMTALQWSQYLANGLGVHWTMECGNDVGEVFLDAPIVPEPTSIVLVGLGLAGFMVRRLRFSAR